MGVGWGAKVPPAPPLCGPCNILKTVYQFSTIKHGIGAPSLMVILHELLKLLYYADAKDVRFIRIGTSGGLGEFHIVLIVTPSPSPTLTLLPRAGNPCAPPSIFFLHWTCCEYCILPLTVRLLSQGLHQELLWSPRLLSTPCSSHTVRR